MTQNTRPAIVLGTMEMGTRVDLRTSFAILDAFVEAGGTWLDTANNYAFSLDPAWLGGASERVIGAWLRSHPGMRAHVRIATKVRWAPLQPHCWPESAEGLGVEGYSALQLRTSLFETRPHGTVPDGGHKMMTADDLDFAHAKALELWAYSPLLRGAYVRDEMTFLDRARDVPA